MKTFFVSDDSFQNFFIIFILHSLHKILILSLSLPLSLSLSVSLLLSFCMFLSLSLFASDSFCSRYYLSNLVVHKVPSSSQNFKYQAPSGIYSIMKWLLTSNCFNHFLIRKQANQIRDKKPRVTKDRLESPPPNTEVF